MHYFLSSLIADCQKHQTKFGDVPLSYAQVGHEKEAVVDHYAEGAGDAEQAKPEAGDERSPLELSLEERITRANNGCVLVTVEELQQLLEIKAEYASDLAMEATGRGPELVQSVPVPRCDAWDGQGHQCVNTAGHEGDHAYLHAVINVEGSASSEPVDALKAHEDHQAQLAADDAAKIPETLQE